MDKRILQFRINAANEKSRYYRVSAYYSEVIGHWKNAGEVRDIPNVPEPLFETDKKYDTKEGLVEGIIG